MKTEHLNALIAIKITKFPRKENHQRESHFVQLNVGISIKQEKIILHGKDPNLTSHVMFAKKSFL